MKGWIHLRGVVKWRGCSYMEGWIHLRGVVTKTRFSYGDACIANIK